MLLALARHGESARNAVKQGRLEYPDTPEAAAVATLQDYELPLSERGREQAERLGPFLRDAVGPVDKCYDSGYLRAIETRSLALNAGYCQQEIAQMQLRSELLLRERESGIMRTMTAADLVEMPIMTFWRAEYEANPFQTRHLGGESVADVCDRVRQFIVSVLDHHTDERVLVFCHDLVMKAFRIILDGQDVSTAIATVQRLEIPNCGVHVYSRVSGTWTVRELTPLLPDSEQEEATRLP